MLANKSTRDPRDHLPLYRRAFGILLQIVGTCATSLRNYFFWITHLKVEFSFLRKEVIWQYSFSSCKYEVAKDHWDGMWNYFLCDIIKRQNLLKENLRGPWMPTSRRNRAHRRIWVIIWHLRIPVKVIKCFPNYNCG